MADYATYADFIIRYPLMKSWGPLGSPSEVNSGLLYYAAQEVDAALAPAYSVPFSSVPPIVRDLTMDLAYIKAIWTKDEGKLAEKMQKRWDTRIENLLSGKASMVSGSGTIISQNTSIGEIWSSTEGYEPTHSMLDAEDAHTMVSSARLQDEENARD